ncbi:class I SAM-dependent methyltransferase, partial [Enterococcus faecium]
FPCQTFLDIAGGTGRYLPFFQEQVTEYTLADISQRMLEIAEAKAQSNVVFLHQSQERLIETGKKFQVVFSAMNPALDTPEKVNALCQLSEEWCLIFRLV